MAMQTTLSKTQEHYTLLTARRFGGTFISTIAQAGIFADPDNRKRIFAAFPELIYQYGPHSHFYNEEQ
jgi:hypothetical protein